jgi:serine/threonine protein phosphatase PrpC
MDNKELWHSVAATVIGPAHYESGLPNQDSVKTGFKDQIAIAAVSDGVGSAKFADIGSKNACRVVFESVELWVKCRSLEVNDLLRLIQTLWLMSIRPYEVNECAATLLFVIVLPTKRVIMAQLGDGVILHWNGENLQNYLLDQKEGFCNETFALRETGILSKWKVIDFELLGDVNSFILLTDGISENIEDGQLEEFAKITDAKLRTLNCQQDAEQWLIDEFENWQTPFHSDDKTIAVLLQTLNLKD